MKYFGSAQSRDQHLGKKAVIFCEECIINQNAEIHEYLLGLDGVSYEERLDRVGLFPWSVGG